ncbi:MAG: hypothetical protein ACE5FW_01675 [Candidatus Aenigmatarchaeota archaeon]
MPKLLGGGTEYSKEIASIKEGIHKLVAKKQREVLGELVTRVDRLSKEILNTRNTLGKDMLDLKDERANIMKEVQANREAISSLQGIQSTRKQLESLVKEMRDNEETTDTLNRNVMEMRDNMSKEMMDLKEERANLMAEIKGNKERIFGIEDTQLTKEEFGTLAKDMQANRERINNLEDMKGLLEDTSKKIEDLQSIAEEIKMLDIGGIINRIGELRAKVQKFEEELGHIKISLPMVIE